MKMQIQMGQEALFKFGHGFQALTWTYLKLI